jgi:hypothetical protein
MKVVLAILGGISLSVMTFVGGLVAATVFFSAGEDKKQLTATNDLWTNHPLRVDVARNDLERLPSRAQRPEQTEVALSGQPNQNGDGVLAMGSFEGGVVGGESASEVDATETGSISPDGASTSDADTSPLLTEAHLEWCSSRYRSYRPRDNSFTPYSGGRRQCESPFLESPSPDIAATDQVSPPPTEEDSFPEETFAPDEPQVEQAAMEARSANYGTWEHAESCFARYRSYRPEDNTYQPHGGGSRRQCQ